MHKIGFKIVYSRKVEIRQNPINIRLKFNPIHSKRTRFETGDMIGPFVSLLICCVTVYCLEITVLYIFKV